MDINIEESKMVNWIEKLVLTSVVERKEPDLDYLFWSNVIEEFSAIHAERFGFNADIENGFALSMFELGVLVGKGMKAPTSEEELTEMVEAAQEERDMIEDLIRILMD